MTMCKCIERVDEKLAEYNGLLLTNWLANPPRAMISICKKNERARQKPPLMEAAYCPFCGTKYKERKSSLKIAHTPQMETK